MSSLGFELLDRHVVDGRADEVAIVMPDSQLRYAELLERVAALGGVLVQMGVQCGEHVAVDLLGSHREVVAVLACIRLGALPGAVGDIRIHDDGDGTRISTLTDTFEWAAAMKAGANDPAATLEQDSAGYRQAVQSSYGEVVDTLLDGGTLTRER